MKWKSKNMNVLPLILFLAVSAVICEIGFSANLPEQPMNNLGGQRGITQNSAEIESLGQFAVQQHNSIQNTFLEFARVVKVNEQVVSGKMYYLTLEAVDGGKKKIYEAKVWVKPWMNFKKLEAFELANGNQ